MKKNFLLLVLSLLSVMARAQTVSFNFTGAVQTYTVPAGVTLISVNAAGACGGRAYQPIYSRGGYGARVTCTMNVTPGQVLNIYVGGGGGFGGIGTAGTGGFNGGAIGSLFPSNYGGGGGGGATDIRMGGTALSNRVIVAGGGGGGAYNYGATDYDRGGDGGGLTGEAGWGANSVGQGGQGGTQTAGGAGSTYSSPNGSPGTLGNGGAGTTASSSGGGGGGGYYGGGGGYWTGGGGGSSFTDPAVTSNVTHTRGFNTTGTTAPSTNGYVVFNILCTNPPANTGTAVLCPGGSSTLTNSVSGGTWSSSNPSIASVVSGTGVVTGVGVGTANISYNIAGGCFSATTVTVNAAPTVSSISTNSPLCANSTLSLVANSPANVTGYSWTGPAAITGASSATASVPAINTSGTGTYSLTVNNGTGAGCTNTYTTSVSILASPAANSGPSQVCEGGTALLGNSVSGGTWTSSNTAVATVNSSGLVTGVAAGTAAISYTLGSGCSAVTNMTVNALPVLNISPSTATAICLNSSTSFTAIAPGATFAWVGISGASGLSCGTCASPTIMPSATGSNIYSVTATSSAGCTTTGGVTVSVDPLPSDISGSSNVCVGTSQTLSGGTGGTWSASSSAVSVGITSGLVTGISSGATTISYTLPTGCYKTFGMTVLPTPAGIGGTLSVCVGSATNLSHSTSGGVWSSSNAGVASVSPSGVVTGGTAGNASISYTLPTGCIVTATATVNALPAVIGGSNAVCESSTITLTNATAGGTWSSSNANATVNAFSGVVSGASAGVSVISYTLGTGCSRTQMVTVNARPAVIGGTASVCHNGTTVLSNATGGGTWISANTSVAFVDASGMVTGITPGTVTVSYSLGTGCYRTQIVTVNALPAVIGGSYAVCQGEVSTLSNTDGGGTWSSSNTGVATVSVSGDVSGASAGNATITYTLGTGCRRTASVTVNALPVVITGTASVCEGSETTLYNFSGSGTWSSGNAAVATVAGSGDVSGVSAGLASITYTLPTGCIRTQVVTVNSLPSNIMSDNAVCVGQTMTALNATTGGTWSSSAPGTATIDASGVVSGVMSGNTTLTYTLPTGCTTTKTITVNALPATISGSGVVCEGSLMNLNNGTPGGAWSSESDAMATVSSAGAVTGVSAGTVSISYTLGTGCYRTKVVTVNALPDFISGSTQVCVSSTTTLSNATGGGVWSSSAAGVASVNISGVVSGLSTGTANISYTLSNGCRRSVTIVVNSLPGTITGALNVCENSTTTLNNSVSGGTWESNNSAIATMTTGGMATGVSAGTTLVSYILPTGCMRTATVNVRPLPSAITGTPAVCAGSTTSLSSASAGGIWSSSSPSAATVSSTGVVSGIIAGNTTITYTLPTSCRTTASVVVNALPASIGGSMSVCAGSSAMLTNASAGGTWISSNAAVATMESTGQVNGITAGTATITYTLATGCYKTAEITVNPLPGVITGGSTLCQGSGLALNASGAGGTWSSSNTSVATISGSGIVSGAAAGSAIMIYTLPTGCSRTTTITVEGTPQPISGASTVCVGSSMMLGNPTSGGIWSSASAVASVSFLGEVTGHTAGTAVITYTLSSGCSRMRTITVNPLPAVSTGSDNVCVGSSVTVNNATAGGMWVSNSDALATVGATSGLVNGMSNGVALISYVLPTGCQRVKNVTVNPTPASIGGVVEMCVGTTNVLNTTTPSGVWVSSNTGVAIVGLGGGNVTGLSSGTSTISYVLATGCLTTTVVTVNANPSSITGLSSVCEGGSTVLSNSTLGGSWSISDAAVSTIDGAGVLSGITSGNATVTYTVGTGCYTTKLIAVNALPAAQTVTGGGSYCAGGSGAVVNLDGSEAMTTYKLYRSGSSTPVGSYSGTGTPLFFGTMLAGGIYTVTATNASGCSRDMNGSATVTIIPVVTPAVSVTSDKGDTVCAGTLVTFGAVGVNGGTGAGYEWSVNGTTVSGTSSSYSYVPVNGDVVTVKMTSSATCAMPAMVTGARSIRVESIETPSATVTASPSTSVCEGTTVTFSVSSLNGGTAPTYTWIKNGTLAMGMGSTLNYTPSDNDVIVCWLNSNYRCLAVNNVPSNNVVLNVDKVYVPEVQVVVTPGTTVEAGSSVTFTATATNAGPTAEYQWLKNGAQISGATTSVYVGNNFADGDSVTCEVKGSGACGEVTINSVRLTVIPTTGIALTEKGAMNVQLMPNPNNGRFVVSGVVGGAAEEVVLEVTNVLGQVLHRSEERVQGGKVATELNLGNGLANGMYLMNVTAGAERTSIHFVVKQ
jgi:trimeric autotransporter adhesin